MFHKIEIEKIYWIKYKLIKMFQILIKIIIERNDIKLTTMSNNDKEKIQIKFYLQENERIKNLVESIKKEKQNYKN